MNIAIGIDLGGTKIAGAAFNAQGEQRAQAVHATPDAYEALVRTCVALVEKMQSATRVVATVGIGIPGTVDRDTGLIRAAANVPCLVGRNLRGDLEAALNRKVRIANDADCAALSEAVDGAGEGYNNVFGLILGTGVGGGLVIDGRLVEGANGLAGEIGHLPLPFREDSDGAAVDCPCGQKGCIDKSASGPALSRLYERKTGQLADAERIADLARRGDAEAGRVLDVFITTLAKAMIPILHMFDPDVIAVSGGLANLPHIYDEVPKRWGRYALRPDIKTRFVPAKHGALSGLRGAAWLGRG